MERREKGRGKENDRLKGRRRRKWLGMASRRREKKGGRKGKEGRKEGKGRDPTHTLSPPWITKLLQ